MGNENLEKNEKLEQIEASALENNQEVSPIEEPKETTATDFEVQEPLIEMSTCHCTGGCGGSYSTGNCVCTGNCGGGTYHKG